MDIFGLLFAFVLVIIIIVALKEPLRRYFSKTRWDFFASHRSTDKRVVAPIVGMLRNRNIRVWIDLLEMDEQQAKAGFFRHPISVGIQQSSFALLFTSKEYCKSEYCKTEAAFFIERFAKQPDHIVEIRLDQNGARSELKIPPSAPCIDFWKIDPIQNKEKRYKRLVDEILLQLENSITASSQNSPSFGTPPRDFKEQRKRLIEDAQLWAYMQDKDIEAEIETIVKQFVPKMRDEITASTIDRIPAHSKEIAEKLLEYPSEVGAFMALKTFGNFLIQNRLGQAPRANLMLTFESMFTFNPQRVDETSKLLTRALCMMDNQRIARSTYTSMVDFRMKSLVREKLLVLNRELWETFLQQEMGRTNARVEKLLKEIVDEDLLWAYRQRAVEALGSIGDPRAIEPMISLIEDDRISNTEIIQALKKLGGSKAVEALLMLLSEGRGFDQGYVAEALGEMQELRAFVPLIETLQKNKEYFTRKKVIWALGKLGDQRAVEPLNNTLHEIRGDNNISPESRSYLEKEIERALESINR